MFQQGDLFPVPEIIDELSIESRKIPHLSEKMLVDLVNGNNTYKDLLISKKDQGFFSKVWGSVDGSNRRREIMMQEHVQHSLETMTSWVLDLTDSAKFTMESLSIVAEKLQDTRDDLVKVANALVIEHGARKRIEENIILLERKISSKLTEFDVRVKKLEVEQEIGKMIAKWENNGLYEGYPLTAQVFFLIDDLIRGERRQIIWENRDTREYLFDSIVNSYRKKRSAIEDLQSLTRQWLPSMITANQFQNEIMSYALCYSKSAKLHNTFSEYCIDGHIPQSLELWQEQGDIPELMDIEDLVKEAGREAYLKA